MALITSRGIDPRHDEPIPGQAWQRDLGSILPTGYADSQTESTVGADGRRRPTITVAGPWQFTRYADGRSGHVTGAKDAPEYREGVAWCRRCHATGVTSPTIRHAAGCAGNVGAWHVPPTSVLRSAARLNADVADVGAYIPKAIDGPRATAPTDVTVSRSRYGAGRERWSPGQTMPRPGAVPDVRADATPDLWSRGGWPPRLTRGTPDRSRVTVSRLSYVGMYYHRTGRPIGPISGTGGSTGGTGTYWPWHDPSRGRIDWHAAMADALDRAADAVEAGIRSGRHGAWLSDGPAVNPLVTVPVLADVPTGRLIPWHAPMVEVRPGMAWRSAGADVTRPTVTVRPTTGGWHTSTPPGAPRWSAPPEDHATTGDSRLIAGPYHRGDAVTSVRSGGRWTSRPVAVRWIDIAPADALSPDVAGYGYYAPSPAATADAMATVASLRRLAWRYRHPGGAPRAGAMPYLSPDAVRSGIGRPVTAKGAPSAPRTVSRRRSRAAILAATAPTTAPVATVDESTVTAARAMLDGGAIG